MSNQLSGGCSGEPLADNGGFVSMEGGMSFHYPNRVGSMVRLSFLRLSGSSRVAPKSTVLECHSSFSVPPTAVQNSTNCTV